MPEPVGFLLTSLARGLILSFVGLNEDEAKEVQRVQAQGQEPDIRSLAVNDKPLTLQFGDGVPIFTKRTQWLCVRNHSGVDTSFSVRARKFPPAPMDPLDFSSTSTAANGLAGTTAKKSTKNGSLGASGTINPDHTSSSPPSNNNRTTRTLKPLHGGGASTSKRRDRKKLRRKLLGQDHELTDRFVSDTGRQLIERNQQLEDGRGLLRAGNGVAFLVPEQVRRCGCPCLPTSYKHGNVLSSSAAFLDKQPPVLLLRKSTSDCDCWLWCKVWQLCIHFRCRIAVVDNFTSCVDVATCPGTVLRRCPRKLSR